MARPFCLFLLLEKTKPSENSDPSENSEYSEYSEKSENSEAAQAFELKDFAGAVCRTGIKVVLLQHKTAPRRKKRNIMKLTPIDPSGIVLIATNRCTSACDHCCFGCNPQEGRSMTFEEMKEYVDTCLAAYPDTLSVLTLTGGECMLLGKDVERIISYAAGRGLTCSIVSNGSWATSFGKAVRTLRRLRQCGLAMAAFSTGEEHNCYVPWQRARDAAVAAARLGLRTELRVEYQAGHFDIAHAIEDDPEVIRWARALKLEYTQNRWMQFYNKGKKPRKRSINFYKNDEIRPCHAMFENITINPYGEVYACCGLGVCRLPQMLLGNIRREPIRTIYERAFQDMMKVWIFTQGPQAVVKFVYEKTGQQFDWHTPHICDICRTILTDKAVLPVVREHFMEALSEPLSIYKKDEKRCNETRRKSKEAPDVQADSQQVPQG